MDQLRERPRFSAAKLAEYVVSMPARRKRLILDQIDSARFRTNRYELARGVIRRFVCDPQRGVETLHVAASKLRDRVADVRNDAFAVTCLLDSARAVEAFAVFAPHFRYRGLIAAPGRRRESPHVICGVQVSVLPDVYLIEHSTERHVGALKFHMSRGNPLDARALEYAAVLLVLHGQMTDAPLKGAHCEAIDVFTQTVSIAPRAVTRRTADINAACEEIAERWPSLRAELAARK